MAFLHIFSVLARHLDAAEITDKMQGDKSDSLTQFYYTADCFDIMHIYQVYAKYANCVIVGQ